VSSGTLNLAQPTSVVEANLLP